MKAISIFFSLFISLMLFGQNNQGTIVYDETIKLEIDVPEEHREQLKGILPESRTAKKVLVFNASESLYKDQEGQDDQDVVEAGSEDSGMHMKMVIERPDNQLYKNIEKEEIFEKQEFFGRDFLVTGDLGNYQWKIANEQKDHLGFTCQKATMEKEDHQVVAWFTPQIPVSNGPMNYGQLPGMILEVDINDGQTHIIASEVILEELADGTIKAPKKGKKVTQDEFAEIVEKKQKEMEEEYGSKGGRMIIHTIKQ